jgi:hypothetical protein
MHDHSRTDELVQAIDGSHALISSVQRDLFALIADADREEVWQGSGARGMAHWLCMRQGISEWKAHRWIAAAYALGRLPRISEAFSSGELGIDKVVELTRFATAETEAGLVGWANTVSGAHIRHRADLEVRREISGVREAERTRHLSWDFFDEGRCFDLRTQMPAAGGAVVATAIERQMAELPVMPGEEDPSYAAARRADALVAICSAQIAADADPDRATVVVHARMDGLVSGAAGGRARVGSGDPPRDRTPAALRREGRDRAGGRLGHAAAARSGHQGADAFDGASAALPGPRVPVPRMRGPAVHPGPSRRLVAERRADGPREPRAHMHVPSQARARAGLGAQAGKRRQLRVVPPEREPVPAGATGGAGTAARDPRTTTCACGRRCLIGRPPTTSIADGQIGARRDLPSTFMLRLDQRRPASS